MGRTVLIVDDQAEFRHVAWQILEDDGFTVVGEAADAADALVASRDLQPDIVLLDVRLPDVSGLDVARTLSGRPGAPAVVLVSTADYRHAVEGCGARGFIPKARLSGSALRGVLAP